MAADAGITKQDLLDLEGRIVSSLKTYVDARFEQSETHLAQIDSRLHDGLAHIDTRLEQIDTRFERIETRLEQIDTRFERIETRLEQIDTRFEHVYERIETVETNLLGAFHGWARSMEVRMRGIVAVTSGFDERLGFVEERVSELERRKH